MGRPEKPNSSQGDREKSGKVLQEEKLRPFLINDCFARSWRENPPPLGSKGASYN